MRVLVELLHIAAGISVALLIAATAAWAYPLAAHDVWLVTWVAIACVVVMGFFSMRRTMRANRADRAGRDDA